jgi:hypothetical protein
VFFIQKRFKLRVDKKRELRGCLMGYNPIKTNKKHKKELYYANRNY